ncbi:TIGR04500 family putative peptide maturation system protein [Nonomuraea sp. NPDC050153]|uniref:TIGR04500 family putative peptide maturation system protein n=1 Tax=Nonomuraea sp. NPDC050153 TaxID=3364359 RepID=UPI00379827CB
MSLPSGRLLADVLAHLRGLGEAAPADARRLTAGLRAAYPDVPMRLVWQQDFPGGPYHYDMLITVAGGTVSLAFAPERALPWPLRGAHHAGEQVLVRVDGVDVTVEQAMNVLDGLWTGTAPATRLVNASLVEQELARHPVELSAAEMQDAMDAFRRARGLLTVKATRAWMAERGMSHERLEEVVAAEASVARLRTRLVGGAVEDAFTADPSAWDEVCVLSTRYPDQDAARAAAERQARRPDASAHALALIAAECLDHRADVRVRRLRRRDLGPGATGMRVGDLLGPPEHEPVISTVLEIRPGTLDFGMRREIEAVLFDHWLAERRARAELRWLWGDAVRTTMVSRALQSPAAAP